MDVDELRRLPPFAGLTDVGLQRLAMRAAELRAAGGQVLALEGDPGAGMFVLCEGNVEVELRSGRLELGPGYFFGELALLVDDGARVARVRATTPVRCVSIPRDDFLALVETEPSFALHMLRELARRLAEARAAVARRSAGSPDNPPRAGDEAHHREPPRAARLPPSRAHRGRSPADRNRGEVAPRRRCPARPGVRGDPGRRGLAGRRVDLRVRGGEHRQPPARARPQVAAPPPRDRLALREGAREGSHARADAPLLQGTQGDGRDRARARQGADRQATRPGRARREAADGTRAQGAPVAPASPIASRSFFSAKSTSGTAVSLHWSTSARAERAHAAVVRPCATASDTRRAFTWIRSGNSPSPRAYSSPSST